MHGAYRAEFKASGGVARVLAEIAMGRNGKRGYNRHMILARFAMRVAEILFLFGLGGSAIVVIITFVEDARELFGKE